MPHAWRWMVVLMACLVAGQPAVVVAEESLDGRSLDTLARTYTTPKAIAAFLHREFAFVHDADLFGEVEHWQSPQEFLSRRRGDCEDYAMLAAALLRRRGIEAHVFSVIGEGGYAHTVCVFKDEQGRYSVINQDKLRAYRAPSLEAVAASLHPGWLYGGIAEQAGLRGRLVQKIVNLHPAPSLPSAPHTFASF